MLSEFIAFLYKFLHFSASASTDTVNRTKSSGNTRRMETLRTLTFRCAVGRRVKFMLTFVVLLGLGLCGDAPIVAERASIGRRNKAGLGRIRDTVKDDAQVVGGHLDDFGQPESSIGRAQ